MYKCPECDEIFEKPDFMEYCLEDYNGVSNLFPNRHYATYASCPVCGTPIDTEYDTYDEEEDEYE